MAYSYPPPFINKLTSETVSSPPIPVVNFNIPPPGFRPSHAVETWHLDMYHNHPPSPLPQLPILLLPQEHSVPQPKEWGQENAPAQEVHTHMTHDSPWLKDWLQKKRMTHTNSYQKQPAVPLKLFEARCMLQLCITGLDELHSLQQELRMKCYDLSPCWREKWDHVKKVQAQVSNHLDKLHNPETLDALRLTLLKRSKKRLRQRRQRAAHKEAVRQSHTRRQQLHKKIDTWLENMQEVVEDAKREESLKHEADQVLAEVTRKKSEAQRQVNMLTALQKLRRIRAQIATNRGQRIDAESGLRFTRVTDHLVKLWEDQLKGYDVEEQGLRAMLDAAVVERTKSEISQDKQILAEWETLLFGKREAYSSFYKAAEEDVDAFVAIRHSWDKFVAAPGAVMSSSIPVGWVLPSNPSTEKWESLLTDNSKKLKI
ncbi:hypothetical protein B7P43_G15266 [Cryptotermes secundus]|uniref:Programmed cell death protein 7 n=1 Tax=Cryptotermes secundus TaxID=105785 RepID=A0A2J7QK35_9NEOP|nr:programmed cell death protein 7 [Cryptotermes secundus]PNF28942.1 hypothetical protein B7P43_G15266 [Cryptotermes secundus]PNF28943.1 hypothetical protein B7P43_G15266 [Cryptotermes secundus]PNF28944.1 hypothetical protein B7P43_G15266 [Cryptotermes secundus]